MVPDHESGEREIARIICEYRPGASLIPGVLRVTSRRISFEPTKAQSRSWSVRLAEVLRVRRLPDGALEIGTGSHGVLVLVDDGSRRVEQSLQTAITGRQENETNPQIRAITQVVPKSVLWRGGCRRVLPDGRRVGGRMTVTRKRLRFSLSDSPLPGIPDDAELELELGLIEGIRLASPTAVQFTSDDIADVFEFDTPEAALRLFTVAANAWRPDDRGLVLESFPAEYLAGEQHLAGSLHVALRWLVFESAGDPEGRDSGGSPDESTAHRSSPDGSPPDPVEPPESVVAIPLPQVTRVELRQQNGLQLVIRRGGERWVFSTPDPVRIYRLLARVLVLATAEGEPPANDEGLIVDPDSIARLWARWSEARGLPADKTTKVCGPVSLEGPSSVLRRGFLCLTPRDVVFLPAATAGAQEQPLVMSADEISAFEAKSDEVDLLVLRTSSGRLQVRSMGPREFVDQCRRHAFVRASDEQDPNQERQRQGGFGSRNRRGFYRAPIAPPNDAVLTTPTGVFAGQVTELSPGGFRFVSEVPLTANAQATLKFSLGGEEHEVQVDTMWVKPPREPETLFLHGLQIAVLTPELEQELRAVWAELQRAEIQRTLQAREAVADDEDDEATEAGNARPSRR